MNYAATGNEMFSIDSYSIENYKIPGIVLMEKAAMAMEEELVKRVTKEDRILIVTEKGNNGGDGLALARLLYHKGYRVDIYEIGAITKASESYVTQREIIEALGIPILSSFPAYKAGAYTVVIDGIFGVGLTRDVTGIHADIIDKMNKTEAFRVAIDIPSGIDAGNAQVMNTAFRADLTITFGVNKIGILLYPGAEYAGEVIVKDIGFPKEAVVHAAPSAITYTDDELKHLPPRKAWSNKGNYGRVLVIAGAVNMAGAAYLCAKAAYRSGAGLVELFIPEENRAILQSNLPDAVMTAYEHEADAVKKLDRAMNRASAIVFGPGLGVTDFSKKLLKQVLTDATCPLLIDADGINLLAVFNKEENTLFNSYPGDIILTPHMKEMSRLTGRSVEEIKRNRITLANANATKHCILVLKDARTIVTNGSSPIYINLTGNNGMAVGGSGDVLSGIIGGLLAQDTEPLEAARLGTYIHGLAGDEAARELGYYSLMAADILDYIYKPFRRNE